MEKPVIPSETPVQPRADGVGMSPRLVVWLILGLAFAVSANSIRNGFAFDDVGLIQTNPLLADPRNAFQFFRQGYWGSWSSDNGSYRPVLMLSFLVNYLWTGLNPWSYHFVNVLLHTANVGLLLLLLHRSRIPFQTVAVTGLIFAIHPIHTEAIANTVGRAELLAAFFFGLSWLCWDCFRTAIPTEKKRWGWLIGSHAAFLLSILTKEHTLTLPVLIFLAEFIHRTRDEKNRETPFRLRALVPYAGFAVMIAICFLARLSVNRVLTSTGDQGVVHLPFLQKMFTMAAAAAAWLRLLTVGYPLRPVYDSFNFGFVVTPDWRTVIGFVWMAAFAWLGWRARRNAPLVTFAVGFWFVTASMMSNLFFSTGSIIAERMLYLPSVAFAMLAGWAFNRCRESTRWQPARFIASGTLAAVCVWYAAVSVTRNADWRDNQSLFSSFLKTDPDHPLAATGLATALEEQGRYAEAVPLYRLTLKSDPANLQARTGLGIHAFITGNREEFTRIFTSLLADEPANLQPVSARWGLVHKTYGELLAKTGQIEQARVQLERANVLFPNFPEIQKSLADVHLLEGTPARAISLYRQVLEHNPTLIAERNNLGVALMRSGKNEEAEAEFREVLRQQPDNRSARANLDFLERKKNAK